MDVKQGPFDGTKRQHDDDLRMFNGRGAPGVFLTKTQRTLTRDPTLQRLVFEAREKGLGLDPWTRKMICEVYEAKTFLKLEDIYAVKYGKLVYEASGKKRG